MSQSLAPYSELTQKDARNLQRVCPTLLESRFQRRQTTGASCSRMRTFRSYFSMISRMRVASVLHPSETPPADASPPACVSGAEVLRTLCDFAAAFGDPKRRAKRAVEISWQRINAADDIAARGETRRGSCRSRVCGCRKGRSLPAGAGTHLDAIRATATTCSPR